MTDIPDAPAKPSVDLATIRYVKRIEPGWGEDGKPRTAEDAERVTQLLNRCLMDLPRGQILEIEKTTGTYKSGETEHVAQRLVYHIGWVRKPAWLDVD